MQHKMVGESKSRTDWQSVPKRRLYSIGKQTIDFSGKNSGSEFGVTKLIIVLTYSDQSVF